MMATNGVWKYAESLSYLHTQEHLQKKRLFPYPIASIVPQLKTQQGGEQTATQTWHLVHNSRLPVFQ